VGGKLPAAAQAGPTPVSGATGGELRDDVPWVHTPFEQPWWLEAVAPGRWGEVVVEQDGAVAARLPYVINRRFGLTALTQAPLTRFLGPWIRPAEGKYATRLGREKALMTELIARLPPCDVYQASFSPAIGNVLPFHWAGFTATVRYTYRLDDVRDPDALWSEFDKHTRGEIRRAQRQLAIRTDLGLDEFLELNRKTLERHGLRLDQSRDVARRLDEACVARRVRTIVAAVDAKERVHAASYTVRDGATTYLLFSGSDPELRDSGAVSFVRWEAIRAAAQHTRSFDFLGSMLEPIERANRGFGARQVPYFFVNRARPHAKVLLEIRRALESSMQTRRRRAVRRSEQRHVGAADPQADHDRRRPVLNRAVIS
jgi:Acetyltransferase (GNAT) domain